MIFGLCCNAKGEVPQCNNQLKIFSQPCTCTFQNSDAVYYHMQTLWCAYHHLSPNTCMHALLSRSILLASPRYKQYSWPQFLSPFKQLSMHTISPAMKKAAAELVLPRPHDIHHITLLTLDAFSSAKWPLLLASQLDYPLILYSLSIIFSLSKTHGWHDQQLHNNYWPFTLALRYYGWPACYLHERFSLSSIAWSLFKLSFELALVISLAYIIAGNTLAHWKRRGTASWASLFSLIENEHDEPKPVANICAYLLHLLDSDSANNVSPYKLW